MNPRGRASAMLGLGVGLALALALGVAACSVNIGSSAGITTGGRSGSTGGSGTGTGGVSGTGGSTATGTGGFSVGTGGSAAGSGGISGNGGFPGCLVTITPVSPPSFVGLESGPDVRLRVMATIRNAGSGAPIWKWKVLFSDQSTIATTVIGGDPKVVEFPVAKPGAYDITVQVNTGGVVCVGEVLPIPVAFTPGPSLLFRVTPPATGGLPLPPQNVKVGFTSAGPSTTMLNLIAGTTYSVALQDQGRVFIPSYVRISGLGSGVMVEGYTAGGPVNAFLLPSAVYDVLVIPDGPVAPMLFSAPSVPANPLVLDPGVLVTGTTRDGNGVPFAGVKIVLRDGVRPSTVGVSDLNGQFSLWSRAGTLSAVMVPPASSGLPEAHVAANPGIALESAAGGLDLQMAWARVMQAAMSLTVKTSDGTSPVVGASVRAESAADLPSIGTLHALSNSMTTDPTVMGSVHIDAISDSGGIARFSRLPAGNYVVTVVPPPSLSASGMMLTTTSINLTGAGYTGELPLARAVKLSGTLLPANITQGARVTAYDKSAGIATETVSTIVGAGGVFVLPVGPGSAGRNRQYQLVADPPVGAHLARTVLGIVDVGAGDAIAGSVSMAAGVSFIGKVQSGANVVGGAFVQVFCSGASTTCLDPRTPVAETVTQQDGSFSVVVPTPGP